MCPCRQRSGKIGPLKQAALLFCLGLVLALAGCSSAPTGSGFFGWWAARGERAAAKATANHDAAREAQLVAARIEAAKATAAAAVLPPSPEATLTQRFTGNTSDLLAQAVPGVTAEQLAAVRQLVADLRSEDAKVVAAAERRQQAAEARNAATSRELGATAAKLQAAEAKASTIAADNAQLAGQLLAMRWAAAAGTILSLAAGAAALAYRANAFGLADGLSRGLADMRKKDPGTADIATQFIDIGLNRAEQTKIATLVNARLST